MKKAKVSKRSQERGYVQNGLFCRCPDCGEEMEFYDTVVDGKLRYTTCSHSSKPLSGTNMDNWKFCSCFADIFYLSDIEPGALYHKGENRELH